MASSNLAGGTASTAALEGLLDSPEIGRLIEELEATRWTGRPGYPIRTMVGLALAKSLYAIPTWTKVVSLVADHWKLQRVLGCEGNAPSVYAAYRFTEKMRANGDMLERCIDSVVEGLKAKLPSLGQDVAVDATDMPAYANGQRYTVHGTKRERFSYADASWGHRSAVSVRKGGGFYGYKLHLACCSKTGLPVAWQVETGSASESRYSAALIDTVRRRGLAAETMAADKGYDIPRVYEECAERDCLPVIPLRQTPRSLEHVELAPLLVRPPRGPEKSPLKPPAYEVAHGRVSGMVAALCLSSCDFVFSKLVPWVGGKIGLFKFVVGPKAESAGAWHFDGGGAGAGGSRARACGPEGTVVAF